MMRGPPPRLQPARLIRSVGDRRSSTHKRRSGLPGGILGRRIGRPWRAGLISLSLLTGLLGCVEPPPQLSTPAVDGTEELDLPEVAADSLLRRAEEVTVRIRTLGCHQFGTGSGF